MTRIIFSPQIGNPMTTAMSLSCTNQPTLEIMVEMTLNKSNAEAKMR